MMGQMGINCSSSKPSPSTASQQPAGPAKPAPSARPPAVAAAPPPPAAPAAAAVPSAAAAAAELAEMEAQLGGDSADACTTSKAAGAGDMHASPSSLNLSCSESDKSAATQVACSGGDLATDKAGSADGTPRSSLELSASEGGTPRMRRPLKHAVRHAPAAVAGTPLAATAAAAGAPAVPAVGSTAQPVPHVVPATLGPLPPGG
jgi:hypothetical protein